MKHILNNLSNEEKNSIREQHTGGIKVMSENFSRLLNAKLGDAKPLVNEQAETKVAGPFGAPPVQYYIYNKGGKFYIYQTNATQKTPIQHEGTIWSNNGQGYNTQDDANKAILLVLQDTREMGGEMMEETVMSPPAPARPTTVMDTLSVPSNKLLFQNSTNNNNIIFLSVRDDAGKVIPNTTYKYKIGGSYSFFDFNVNIRNLKRDDKGNLIGEALPSNSMAASAMRSLIPKQNLTTDGWLMIKIPNQKLTEGIQSLKSTKGQTAEIDAGQGVKVSLQYIGK
jgi:hypothetical protein